MTVPHARRATHAAVSIVLGHTQVLYREGLGRVLGRAGFEVLAQAGDAAELRRAVLAQRPDVVISDTGCDGAGIRREFSSTAVLMLSQRVCAETAGALVGDGAEGVGYLLEQRIADVEQFADAVRRIAAGGSVLDPEVVATFLGERRGPVDELTAREREVLKQVAEGRSNLGVAKHLYVSEHAVEKHMSSILSKLGIPIGRGHHRRVLAVLALRQAV